MADYRWHPKQADAFTSWSNQASRPSATYINRPTTAKGASTSSTKYSATQNRTVRIQTQLAKHSSPTAPKDQGEVDLLRNIVAPLKKLALSNPYVKVPGKPLTYFYLFPDLPSELRIKIWALLMEEGRLIEVERGAPPCHCGVQISPGSRLPPPIFHVNREARGEALRVYELRDFEVRYDDVPHCLTYFQSKVDILYFGDKACISTAIVCFRRYQVISRVAINCSGSFNACCQWDDHDGAAYIGPDEAGGYTTMQVLHGVNPDVFVDATFPPAGCNGLKEVIFIIKSNYEPIKSGEVDSNTRLRPAVSDGLTKGQKREYSASLKEIENARAGKLKHVGANKWEDDNMPEFKFMSLTPLVIGNKVYDSMVTTSMAIRKLSGRDWEFLKSLKKRTGCRITVIPEAWRGEKEREIGFYGIPKSVEMAKTGILDFVGGNSRAKPDLVKDSNKFVINRRK